MTDEELIALKELAQKAKPFPTDGKRAIWEEQSEEDRLRAGYNGALMVAAHAALPDLIDEVLKYRGWTHGRLS